MITVIRQSARILTRGWQIWFFGLLAYLPALISIPRGRELSFPALLLTLWLRLALLLVSLLARGGLIDYAYTQFKAGTPAFQNVLKRTLGKLPRLLGLVFLLSPLLLVGILLIVFLFQGEFSSSWFLVGFSLLEVFMTPLLTFGMCGILLHGLKPLPAGWTALLMTLNNIFKLSLVTAALLILRLACLALLALFVPFSTPSILPAALNFHSAGYSALRHIPLFNGANHLLDLLTGMVFTVILTLLFQIYSREIEYPALHNNPPVS